jgi:nucleotide-binding universal stress UspA family protein
VLVAVDGSEVSWRALDFAVEFAQKYGASLLVLNVSESTQVVTAVPPEPAVYMGEGTAAIAKDLETVHENILNKALSHAKTLYPSLAVSGKLRMGDAAAEIVAEAHDGSFDVVMVGHVGTGRMIRVKELLGLGGISKKVADQAPCSVIIVR